jgi:hypothetical protein
MIIRALEAGWTYIGDIWDRTMLLMSLGRLWCVIGEPAWIFDILAGDLRDLICDQSCEFGVWLDSTTYINMNGCEFDVKLYRVTPGIRSFL